MDKKIEGLIDELIEASREEGRDSAYSVEWGTRAKAGIETARAALMAEIEPLIVARRQRNLLMAGERLQ